MAQNIPRGTPARVLVILALLMGLVTVSAWRDALQRDAATWIRHPTALGDARLYPAGHPPVHLTKGGTMITLTVGTIPFHRRDDRMFRVSTGYGEELPFSVFSTRENLEGEPEPKLYVRVAPHEFRRLRANLGAPGGGMIPPSPGVQERPLPEVRKAIPLEEEAPQIPDNPDAGETL